MSRQAGRRLAGSTHATPDGSLAGRRATRIVACAGLLARGLVYLVMGWLAIEVALGRNRGQLNQKGALAEVASRAEGRALLVVLAVGLAAYALWRLSQAVWGTPENGRKTGPRAAALLQGLAYGVLCFTAVQVLRGSSGPGQAQQQQSATARLMRHPDGRWLVGGLGAVVVVIGLAMIAEGVRRRFLRSLRTEQMRGRTRRIVVGLGVFGSTARGIVVALAGALTIDAAATADPAKSAGLDGALRSLARDPAGPWLLGVAALGLITFGAYSAVSARWART